jgi:hypothetical protein
LTADDHNPRRGDGQALGEHSTQRAVCAPSCAGAATRTRTTPSRTPTTSSRWVPARSRTEILDLLNEARRPKCERLSLRV